MEVDLTDLQPFVPCVVRNEALDQLTIRLEDASVTGPMRAAAIELLYSFDGTRIVGVKIWDVSRLGVRLP